MKLAAGILCSLALWSPLALAAEKTISQDRNEKEQCNGMYSRKAWGGDTDPFILTKFIKSTPEGNPNPQVSLVVFEWRDEDLVGVYPNPDTDKV